MRTILFIGSLLALYHFFGPAFAWTALGIIVIFRIIENFE